MDHCVDQCLEQGLFAVLGQIRTGRILPCRDMHVSGGERNGAGDLCVQRTGDFPGVDLARCTVSAPVSDRRDAGAGKPLFRIRSAQQHAGDGGAKNPGLVVFQERQFPERRLGFRRALGAQQRFPVRLGQCIESGPPAPAACRTTESGPASAVAPGATARRRP